MIKWFKSRDNILLLGIMACMIVLMARLFSITIVQGEVWEEKADTLSARTISTTAPRGRILDRYGRLLAGNVPSFTVQFTAGNLSSSELNEQSLKLINILEENNDKPLDNVPIVIAEDGSKYYTHDKIIEEWLINQGMPVDFTADDAFAELKRRYGISDEATNYEAQQEMILMHNISPPISVATTPLKFRETLNKEQFLGTYFNSDKFDISAEEAFQQLREKRYNIDPNLSDEDARKIIVVRYQISALGFLQYNPAKIAKNVSDETVVAIEERSSDMPGIEILTESVRYYPNESSAAHILGYIGVVSAEERSDKAEDGIDYAIDDMIGKNGIEGRYEGVLRGENGTKLVEVNAHGQQVSVISEVKPKKGQDVYLTIDLELQKVAEEALEHGLAQIRVGGTFQSKWGPYRFTDRNIKRNANTGAVVVLDVKDGDVLAMASYPAYDPNLFSTGISTENWQALQGENQRDSLAALPLVNIATRTAVQPGSTFKMVTAAAALESGWNPRTKLYDDGFIKLGGKTFGCWLYNEQRGRHGALDLYEAIEKSCNYYFYNLVSNKDWYRNRDLGMDDMNVNKLLLYAEEFGLDGDTGIEIYESPGKVPTAIRKKAGIKGMLKTMLYQKAMDYFEPHILESEANLSESINNIADIMDEELSHAAIVARLQAAGIKEDVSRNLAYTIQSDYIGQSDWNVGDDLNLTIGQGLNAYTPLQMARYVATIANGGVRNDVSVVRAVEGQGVLEKPDGVPMTLNNPDTISHVQQAMERVARKGTTSGIRQAFDNFPVKVAAKTGTAQKSGKIQPPDEVEYIKQYLNRFDRNLVWEEVETEMYRLMETYPSIYKTTNSAVRQAVLNISNVNLTYDNLDFYKDSYHNFSWFVCYAPADDPEIAIAVLLVQGGTGGNGAPIAREIIGAYMDLEYTFEDYRLDTEVTQ